MAEYRTGDKSGIIPLIFHKKKTYVVGACSLERSQ